MPEWAEWVEFCEVSRNNFSYRCWKFQLSILKNKKVLFLKKYDLVHLRQSMKKSSKIQVLRAYFAKNIYCDFGEEGISTDHRRRKCEGSSPNSLRPISYFGSICELYVLDLKTKVFCKKKNQLHFPMDKGRNSQCQNSANTLRYLINEYTRLTI